MHSMRSLVALNRCVNCCKSDFSPKNLKCLASASLEKFSNPFKLDGSVSQARLYSKPSDVDPSHIDDPFDDQGHETILHEKTRGMPLLRNPATNKRDQLCLRKETVLHTKTRGAQLLRNPITNKGMAFSLRERQLMGIHGLLPPAELTQEQQIMRVMKGYNRIKDNLDKYLYLVALRERNEKLFFAVISQHISEMLPIIYTPTVGLACQKYGIIYRKPRGLFISIHDKGHIYEMLCNWPEKDVRAVVVTDGERILGLGDLGCYGMGIPVGKLTLYTALAGVKPRYNLPIMIDVGTNNQQLLEDPFYIGLRQRRVTGETYDEFMDELMTALVRKYGQNTLIQFEDFANHNAYRLLKKYRNKYTYFNDDIQGTASVTVSGLLSSLRITGTKLADNNFLFLGAGGAACGVANLIVMAMQRRDGLTEEEAAHRIWMMDIDGLLTKGRPHGEITEAQQLFAKDHQHTKDLGEAIDLIKPNVIIGVAGATGAFNEKILRKMATINERPIVFALSNPTSKAECTAEQAYAFTDGRAVFASGSPFPPVTVAGRTLVPSQSNNAYIFPGIALATIYCNIRHIPEDVFLLAAETLASLVDEELLERGQTFPPLDDLITISVKVATRIGEWAYENKVAQRYPKPSDMETFFRGKLYSTKYESFIPDVYDWPSIGGHEI